MVRTKSEFLQNKFQGLLFKDWIMLTLGHNDVKLMKCALLAII